MFLMENDRCFRCSMETSMTRLSLDIPRSLDLYCGEMSIAISGDRYISPCQIVCQSDCISERLGWVDGGAVSCNRMMSGLCCLRVRMIRRNLSKFISDRPLSEIIFIVISV